MNESDCCVHCFQRMYQGEMFGNKVTQSHIESILYCSVLYCLHLIFIDKTSGNIFSFVIEFKCLFI